jgi:hypothetical protein
MLPSVQTPLNGVNPYSETGLAGKVCRGGRQSGEKEREALRRRNEGGMFGSSGITGANPRFGIPVHGIA